MKKHLITALLAIVAVGGVLTTRAEIVYGPADPSGTPEYDCSAMENLCAEIEGPLYYSDTQQDESTIVADKQSELGTTRFNEQ